jgi:hypothetical protein
VGCLRVGGCRKTTTEILHVVQNDGFGCGRWERIRDEGAAWRILHVVQNDGLGAGGGSGFVTRELHG